MNAGMTFRARFAAAPSAREPGGVAEGVMPVARRRTNHSKPRPEIQEAGRRTEGTGLRAGSFGKVSTTGTPATTDSRFRARHVSRRRGDHEWDQKAAGRKTAGPVHFLRDELATRAVPETAKVTIRRS